MDHQYVELKAAKAFLFMNIFDAVAMFNVN
jgi:hypothetical protein